MNHRRLGARGPEISVVGYGAWEIGGEAYGPNPTAGQVQRAILASIDAGMDWIDTAEIYGRGQSERLVGKALAGRRESVRIATKVAPEPVGTGFAPGRVRKALESSLRRTGTDHIDLYQLHWWPGGDYPIEETWGAMAELVDEGLVSHIGVSNFDREQIERCRKVRHVDSLQPQLSMLHREGSDLIQWCGENGIGVIVYGPLAYGLLTGTVSQTTRFPDSDWRSGRDPDHPYYRDLFAPPRLTRHLQIVDQLRKIATRMGFSPAELALAWCLHQPGVTAAIAGSRDPEHSRQNASGGDVALTGDDLAEIDRVLKEKHTPKKSS